MPPPRQYLFSSSFLSSRFYRPHTSLTSLRPHRPSVSLRPFSTSHTILKSGTDTNPDPQRDAQKDREKISPDANEYSKSGTDTSAAAQDEAAYNDNISDPQEAKKEAGKGNEVNPLDASPANPDISSPTSEEEGGVKKKKSE